MTHYTKINCSSRYTPTNVVTNDMLPAHLDTSDEWIRTRTGIEARNIVTDENTSDLCIQVARKLLEKSGKKSEELDFIIVATMTPDYGTPSVACQVQGAIHATNAFAFDISAACSGFVYALSMGDKLIRTGNKCGLIIGGEVLSKVTDWQDRRTAVLFGDGAAGVLIEQTESQHFIKEQLQAEGSRGQSLTSGFVQNKNPYYTKQEDPYSCLQMDGRGIYNFALKDVAENIREIVQEETVDYLLLHQANKRMVDQMAKELQIPREKFLTNMEKNGNTSAASIPLLLDEAIEQGILKIGSNQKIVLTGFGGGLTWGSILLTL